MRWYQLDTLNLMLALLLAGLLILIFKPSVSTPAVMAIDPQQINDLRIEQNGAVKLALLKDDSGWQITHPVIARANRQRVATLLGLLQAPGVAVKPESLQAAGLQQPRLRLIADQAMLEIGGPSVPAGQRYARFNGHTYLIDEYWYRLLTLPARFYQAQ